MFGGVIRRVCGAVLPDSYCELRGNVILLKKKAVSTYLYCVENALIIFHKHPDYHTWLNNMFNLMIEKTYTHLQDINKDKIDPELRIL